jgi:hypothetical protein
MPIEPTITQAVRRNDETRWHLASLMDTEAKPHPEAITACEQRVSIIGSVFRARDLVNEADLCEACARRGKPN